MNNGKPVPSEAIKGIASGLFLMSLFTFIWSGIAFGSLRQSNFKFAPLCFLIFIVLFIIQGFRFFTLAKKYPASLNSEDVAEKKRVGMWFGIIFGAEGLLIFVSINLVIYFGHPDLVIPVIALVVGLHFFPMAKIFRRQIDYHLATWSTGIALCGIFFTINKRLSPHRITTFVGIGMALATTAYGLFMIYTGRKLVEKNMLNDSGFIV